MPHRFISCYVLILAIASTALASVDSIQSDLDEATAYLVNFDFLNAHHGFSAALNQLEPDHPLWIRAAYGTAVSAQHMTPPTPALIEQANQLYKAIASTTGDDAFAARAAINLGRIDELRDYAGDEIDLSAARRHYEQVISRWPDSLYADEATLWLAGTYIQVLDDGASVRRGVAILEQWLEQRPDNAYAAAMQLYLADTYFLTLDDSQRAVTCYVRADELGLPVRARAGIIYWRLATLAVRTGQVDTAIAYFQKIVRITPTSGRAYESQQALKRLAEAHPEKRIVIPTIELYNANTPGDTP